jgi:putative heme-binding domain-containing protein
MLWRQTAQRLLVDGRRTDAIPALTRLPRQGGSEPALIHALWTLHGLDAFSGDNREEPLQAARAALRHSSPAVRRTAVAVLPRTSETTAAILEAACLNADDPRLRRDTLLALSEMPGSRSAAAAVVAFLRKADNADDRWIARAAICAAAQNDLDFLQAAAAAGAPEAGQLALVQTVRVVAEHVARKPAQDAPGRLLALLGTASPPVTEALLAGLAAGWPQMHRVQLGEADQTQLTALAGRMPPATLLQLARLLQLWGQSQRMAGLTGALRKALLQRVNDDKLSEDNRLAAAGDLVALGADDESLTAILELLTPRANPSFSRALLEAVGASSSAGLGERIIARYGELTPAARPTALALLLRRTAWARALLTALEKDQIDRSELSLDQVQQLSQHPDGDIAAQARKILGQGGRLPTSDRQKVLDTFLPLAQKRGDAARGKVVFENNCGKCHRLGDLGATVGPDLTGIAVRPRPDILTDILDPNRSVEGNYRQYSIETKQGTLLTGLLVAETRTTVELLDSEAKKHVVLRDDIDTLTKSRLSLMPEGFEKLGEADLASLLDFLTTPSKYIPLPLGKAATITSVRGMFTDPENPVERLIFPKWSAQTFAGVPFQVIDPRNGSLPNVILLRSPLGAVVRQMPRSASLSCGVSARAIHLLSGVGGWCFPYGKKGDVALIVRLHYADGKQEDHSLLNGIHFADYIRVVDVPESRLAFRLRGQQVRYLALHPKRSAKIDRIEFLKGSDDMAPVVMAVTIETGQE